MRRKEWRRSSRRKDEKERVEKKVTGERMRRKEWKESSR